MKRIIPFLFLAVAAFAQVNVQKTSGTNAITGNLVIGDGKSISATGTGSIGATALSGDVTARDETGISLKNSAGVTIGIVASGNSTVAAVSQSSSLTADGTFTTTNGWTAGSGWSIAAGKATHTAGTALLSGTTTVESGVVYKIVFTTSGRTAGDLLVKLGSAYAGIAVALKSNAAQTCYAVAPANNAALSFEPSTDYDGSIDGVALYAVTESTANATLYSSDGVATPLAFRSVGSAYSSLGVGHLAAANTLSGGRTTAVGYAAARANTTGSVTAVGLLAGASNTAGNLVAMGEETATNTVAGNVSAFGHNAAYSNTRGVLTAVGYRAAYSNTTGVGTMIGDEAGYNNTTGYFTGVGYVVGRANTTGVFTGVGHYTGKDNTTGAFTGFGFTAGYQNTTGVFTGVGQEVGYSNTSGYFTGVGYNTGYANTTGDFTGFGHQAGRFNTTGAFTGFGFLAGFYNTTGSLLAVGYRAGTGVTTTNAPVTDTYGILIGYEANRSVPSATQLTNYIGIGKGVEVDKSNQVKIGNPSIVETVLYGQQLHASGGTAEVPLISSTPGGGDTGLYFPYEGYVGIATNGLRRLEFDPDGNGVHYGNQSIEGVLAVHNGSLRLNATLPSTETDFSFRVGSLDRWIFNRAGAESGANAGGNLYLYRYADDGSYLGTALAFTRATGALAIGGNLTATNLSGTNTGDQTITLSGDVSGSGTGAITATLGTVNSNVGTYGSATAVPQITLNGKGLATAAANVTITPAVGSITGLGTGVATALAATPDATGGLVTHGGALGAATATTPSANDNDTSVATTAYVQTELSAYAADTVTLTNKRITARVQSLTDAASVTPASDDYDGGLLATLSQTTQIENPSGTPANFQRYVLRITSSSARSLTWGTQFRGSTDLALPASTTGSSKTDYFFFQWNASDATWDLISKTFGF